MDSLGRVLWCLLCVLLSLPSGHREVFHREVAKRAGVVGICHCLQHAAWSADGSLPLPQPAPGERREGLLADADLGGGCHHSSARSLCSRHRLLARQGQLLGQQHARLLRDPLPLQRSHDGSHPDDDSDAELGCHRASPAFGHRRSVPSVHVHRGSGRALHSHRPAIPCKFREAAALQEVLKSGRDPSLLARTRFPYQGRPIRAFSPRPRVQMYVQARPLRPGLRESRQRVVACRAPNTHDTFITSGQDRVLSKGDSSEQF
mmetsp:Transcript_21359/g.50821  ORF Transcript_21359/g.50821 Transcript_21359/m.50821 type:complete len:261 (+) Transcript_21359:2621-3403(+)